MITTRERGIALMVIAQAVVEISTFGLAFCINWKATLIVSAGWYVSNVLKRKIKERL